MRTFGRFFEAFLLVSISIGEIYAQSCPPATGGAFTGPMTITTDCVVNGNLDLQSGNLTISSGASLQVNGDFVNSGNAFINVLGGLNVTGSFDNQGNGQVDIASGATLDVGVDYSNGGDGITNFNGDINIGGNYLNQGDGNISSGGTVTIGGNFTVGGDGVNNVDGGLSIGGTATLGPTGININNGGVLKAGNIVNPDGPVTVANGGTLFVPGTVSGTTNVNSSNPDTDCTNNCCGSQCNTAGNNLSNTGLDVLPVTLIAYQISIASGNVLINWATATEINNDFFKIERSYDAVSFEEIARVKGAGNSKEVQSYSFKDDPPVSGLIYYRLSQTDFDGTMEVFSLKVVNLRAFQNTTIVYPTNIK